MAMRFLTVLLILPFLAGPAYGWGERFISKRQDENHTTREVIMHMPATLPPEGTRALVIVLHGGGGNADRIASKRSESGLNMNKVADEHGFVVAYLNGTKVARMLGSDKKGWNAGNCCGMPSRDKVDDVTYISDVVASLSAKYGIDRRRVYAIGHSNGAMMAMRMVCERDVFAAIMPVSGTLGVEGTCTHAQGKPIHAIRGENDKHVPLDGGVGEGPSKTDFKSQAYMQQVFTAAGAQYSSQIVPGAGHKFDDMDKVIQASEGISIAEKAAQFFGLVAK